MTNRKTEEEVLRLLKQMPRYELGKETMEKHLQRLSKQTMASKPKRGIRKRGIRLIEWFGFSAAVMAIVLLIPQLAPFDSAPASLQKNPGTLQRIGEPGSSDPFVTYARIILNIT